MNIKTKFSTFLPQKYVNSSGLTYFNRAFSFNSFTEIAEKFVMVSGNTFK